MPACRAGTLDCAVLSVCWTLAMLGRLTGSAWMQANSRSDTSRARRGGHRGPPCWPVHSILDSSVTGVVAVAAVAAAVQIEKTWGRHMQDVDVGHMHMHMQDVDVGQTHARCECGAQAQIHLCVASFLEDAFTPTLCVTLFLVDTFTPILCVASFLVDTFTPILCVASFLVDSLLADLGMRHALIYAVGGQELAGAHAILHDVCQPIIRTHKHKGMPIGWHPTPYTLTCW